MTETETWWLVAFGAVACSIGQNAILAGVSLFHDGEYGSVVAAVWGPALPVALAQLAVSPAWFEKTNVVHELLVLTLLTSSFIPFVILRANSSVSLFFVAIVGSLSSWTYGSLQRLVASQSSHQAAFAFGYQGLSGMLVFCCAFFSGFHDAKSKPDEVYSFFRMVGLAQLAATLCCAAYRRRERMRPVPPILPDLLMVSESNRPTVSVRLVIFECFALLLTVAATAAALPYYARFRVASASPHLGQHLFFVRMSSDALSRPCTMLAAQSGLNITGRTLVFVSIFRLIFMIPIIGNVSWGWRATPFLLGLLIALYSFASGFVVTSCYQVASAKGKTAPDQARIATILNVVFAAGLFAACAMTIYG